jgi:CheY-like chemotaxis protein
MTNTRAMVVDDDQNFLRAISQLEPPGRVTLDTNNNAAAALKSLDNAPYDALVSDLVMPGQQDGISVLEQAHNRFPGMNLMLMTSYDLSPVQRERLRRIKAQHYDKTQAVEELIRDLAQLDPVRDGPAAAVIGQRAAERLLALEELHRDWVEDIAAELEKTGDLENARIATAAGSLPLTELIDELRALTPRGIYHAKLIMKARRTLAALRPRR